MIIGGPYSAGTAEQRKKNLDAMNIAAARLLEKGHIPLIGVNAALPVVEMSNTADRYKAIMDISLAVIDKCLRACYCLQRARVRIKSGI